MASRLIEVNTTTLRSDVSTIEEELKGLRACCESLEAALATLLTKWEGNSARAFDQAVRDDVRRLRELEKMVRSLTTQTSTARSEYDKCENAVSQIVASIRV